MRDTGAVPSQKISAVAFDLGGVLIDWNRDKIMAWAERGEEMAAGPFEQAVRVLADLKAAGVRCYALSNMEPGAFAVRCARSVSYTHLTLPTILLV